MVRVLTGWLSRFAALVLLGMALPSWAAGAPVTVGVLAFRPKPEMTARWQPTIDYLSQKTGRPFVMEVLDYPELETAIRQRRVDFVLTNPSHYVLMTKRNGLSSPLATLIELDQGLPLTQFGGVIFTRAKRADIRGLADLAGKKIATPDVGSFGGYQMQAFELAQAGLPFPEHNRLLVTGMPHDKTVYAVLESRADAGFVRTGVLESLIAEGRVKRDDIRVLVRHQAPGFPYLLSTRLYPEWPFAALPDADPDLAQAVAQALFSLREHDPAAVQGRYHGWAIPADYEPVRALLQELRLPPYDQAPVFTLDDVLARHGTGILLIGFGGFLVLALLVLLAVRNRQLRVQDRRLAESELRFRQFADNTNIVIWLRTAREMLYVNKAYETIWGRTRESLYADPASFLSAIHPDDRARVREGFQNEIADSGRFDQEYRVVRPDGAVVWVHARSFPVFDEDGAIVRWTGMAEDITAARMAEAMIRRQAEERQQLLSALGEGVYGVDTEGRCTFVNPAALAMLGFAAEELLERDLHALTHHHRKDGEPYPYGECPIFQTLLDGQVRRQEEWFYRKDGTGFPVELTVAPTGGGEVPTGAVVVFRDIGERKEMEAELQAQAITDVLTGLPNRRHFLLVLTQEIARLRRYGDPPSTLLMLDLDHFKQVNDNYGHSAGDAVLRQFADLVRDNLRKTDEAGRLGGEEFVILLYGTPGQGGVEFAERLREAFHSLPLEVDGRLIRASVSIGVTELSSADGRPEDVLARADVALYRAKANGRNRVELS